jgi:hypothetical protein
MGRTVKCKKYMDAIIATCVGFLSGEFLMWL